MVKLWKRKLPPREEKQAREREKIESEVFDRKALIVLGELISRKILKSLDYPIAKGKEANVFRATAGEKLCEETPFLAVKIYRIETGSFVRMQDYIFKDPRFEGIEKNKRDVVYAWAQKEFNNLQICAEAGVPAPKPFVFSKNVLVMEFLGENGIPDSTLQQVGSEKPEEECESLLCSIRKLYKKGLVHADVSEFNVLMHMGVPHLIDIGQGVLLAHPKAQEFLERDVENVLRYFRRCGVKKNKEEIVRWIRE